MSARRLCRDEGELLLPLAHGFAFKPYRHYRTFSAPVQETVLASELRATLSHPDGLVYLGGEDGARAAVVARRLAWDSDFFGVPMARIEYVLGDDEAARGAVLLASLQALRDEGVLHVSARIDAADLATTLLLERGGFRLMDGLVTYAMRPGRRAPNAVRGVGTVRP
ncbi:MAG: hypothetical protein JO040_04530, partial [Gemmatimonadetes bacterium]|nr:hypothetical protein [Gemmatimonadota bacterium]